MTNALIQATRKGGFKIGCNMDESPVIMMRASVLIQRYSVNAYKRAYFACFRVSARVQIHRQNSRGRNTACR
jgi:hypothetical protein